MHIVFKITSTAPPPCASLNAHRPRQHHMAVTKSQPCLTTMAVTGLLYAVLVVLMSSCGTVRSAAANGNLTVDVASSVRDNCWVFMHLQKCGGSTVKGILKQSFGHRFAIYDTIQWKKGSVFAEQFGNSLVAGGKRDVVAGGYPEALRFVPAVNKRCQWFTMFRHPISRMVSAYYYCRKAHKDSACGSEIVDAREVDLTTFAKHWGNFALRQFALGLVPVDDVLEYWRTDAARKTLPPRAGPIRFIAPWYLLEKYLDNKYLEDQATTSQHVEIPDVVMYTMIQPVQDLLRDRYTVGILEEFNTTLSLFDVALDMPGVNWHKQYIGEGAMNVDITYEEEKAAALVEAWTNSEIKQYMRLDLVLYEHAVDVFHQQARAYGLE